jgi:signal transduction histidine kinase
MSGGHSTFSVADDGAGLDRSQAEVIFEPFRRLTHLAGCSGLGLATCRRIVALYGGEISCDSAPGRGATFTFTLPATEKADRDSYAKSTN